MGLKPIENEMSLMRTVHQAGDPIFESPGLTVKVKCLADARIATNVRGISFALPTRMTGSTSDLYQYGNTCGNTQTQIETLHIASSKRLVWERFQSIVEGESHG